MNFKEYAIFGIKRYNLVLEFLGFFYIFGLYSFRCLHFDSKLYFFDISVPLSLKMSEKVVKKIEGEKKLLIGHKKIKIGVNGFIFEKRI